MEASHVFVSRRRPLTAFDARRVPFGSLRAAEAVGMTRAPTGENKRKRVRHARNESMRPFNGLVLTIEAKFSEQKKNRGSESLLMLKWDSLSRTSLKKNFYPSGTLTLKMISQRTNP